MEKEILEKLEKAKEEAIKNPGKKKKGCASCKKKKDVVTELPKLEEPLVIYTDKDFLAAYHELRNLRGVREEKKQYVSDVYEFLFSEPFDFNCRQCVNQQAIKLHNYLHYHLKLI